ncbi:sodium:calcium antiporter [Capilliphycus salinus ALCB114379]|uniref:sodium:calcium antiporter n=1 Tax=Capilliphycus salinus TaxID=2768948 RepID=UPI0039A443B9
MSESLEVNLLLFILSAIVIGIGGTKLSKVADQLADATGLGEAVVGALLLGGITSLAGIITSITAAADAHPQIAVSNALGGIAAQTAFLAIADFFYCRANLEHAAASLPTLVQGALLNALLAIPLLAVTAPNVEFLGIHPASIAIICGYLFGLRIVSQVRDDPMWKPQLTTETLTDENEKSDPDSSVNLPQLWLMLGWLAIVIAGAGYLLAKTGVSLSEQTAISETVVGGLFIAISTALPELVTSVAAVKRGAITLAISAIIGGNSFDVLLLSFSDFAYPEGSIYNAITQSEVFVIGLTILMTSILLLGLLKREKSGIGNIGFETFSILVLYLGGFVILLTWG